MSKSNSYTWPDNVFFETEADKDFAKLDHSQQLVVFKAIKKVATNPRPSPDGYGKPLSGNLMGYCKIKLRDYGIRIIYKLVPPDSDNMSIIIIGMRSDEKVYEDAMNRISK